MSPTKTPDPDSPEFNIFKESIRFTGHRMASSMDLLTKINDEFLTCQICFETYTMPKSLNCQHTFCQKCLEEYLPSGSTTLTCPTCRTPHSLTDVGIDGLKDNFFISSMADMLKTVKEIRNDDNSSTALMCDTCDIDTQQPASTRCLDCTDFLCTECSTWHRRTKLTRSHKIVSLSEFESGMHNEELKSRAKIYCSIHEGEAAKIYCQTCQCPICHECLETDHVQHQRRTLKEEVVFQSLQIEELLATARDKTTVLRTMQTTMDELKQLKKGVRDGIEAAVKTTCANYIKAINKRKDEMLESLNSMHSSELKQIHAHEDSIEIQLSSLVSCTEFSKKVLEYGTPKEVLGLNKQMALILHQLLETHPALNYHKVDETPEIQFTTNSEDIKSVAEKFGSLDVQKAVFPDNINKVFRDLDHFCTGEPQPFIPVPNHIPVFTRAESVETTKLVAQIGKQGSDDGEFESTPNVAVNSAGEVVTSDYEACKIQLYDPKGNFKDSFITEVNEKVFKPTGVATLHNDDIVVCSESEIHVWTHEGKRVLGFGKGMFGNCNSVAVDSENKIIATDVTKHCVLVFKDDGTFVRQFTITSKSDYKIAEPRYVTCDSQNNIIVSDGGNCSVKKFNYRGELLYSFGGDGPDKGQFQGPGGVAVDKNDNILVADCWNHRIDMFTPEGSFIRHVATGTDGLHFPWSIAITKAGKLVLSEDYSWCAKIFSFPELRTDSLSSLEDITSPTSLIPDLEQLAGQFDLPNILNNKLSWWLNSNTTNQFDSHAHTITNSSLHHTISNPTRPKPKSKSLTSKVSSSSDSDLTATASNSSPAPPPPTPSTNTHKDLMMNGRPGGLNNNGIHHKKSLSGKLNMYQNDMVKSAIINGS